MACGQAARQGGNSRDALPARSTICPRRTRFTGPCTRNRAPCGRLNCVCRKSDRCREQPADTSSRTACPKWRCCRPWRSAVRRLPTSSSSTARSEWRVTRNCENSVTSRPGNRSPRWARMMLESSTNSCSLAGATRAGMRMTRGRARGTRTMAISLARPNASWPLRRTMKLSDLLATSGKGWAGSSPTGTSRGRTSRWKYSCTQRRCSALRTPCETMRSPCAARAGARASL